MKDEDILRELAAGNEACIKHLYAHLKMVTVWVMRNSGTEDDALDLFQEAMAVFCNNFRSGKYQHRAKISTYLFEICKRNWYNQLNRERIKKNPIDGTIEIEEIGGITEMEMEFGNHEISLQEYLEEALDKLGEPCKSLLVRTIYFKVKMAQLAIEFGYADAHSARQQRFRCLNRLRSFVSYDVILQLN